MARRILNRRELRNDYDAAERRNTDEKEVEDEEEVDDEDEDEEEAEGESEEGDEEGEEGDEDEEKPKKKKAVKVAKPKAKPKARARTAKVTRMRLVWGVFNNSNQCVTTFPYPKRKDADDHAAKLTADKKNTHFVQPVKEPMEEK